MAPWDSPSDNLATRRATPDRGRTSFMSDLAARVVEKGRKRWLRPSDVTLRAAVAELMRPYGGGVHGHYSKTAGEMVERIYNSCPATTAYINKATTSPAVTGTAGWAAELVTSANVVDFLVDAAAPSAFAQLAARALTVPATGRALLKVPSRSHPISPAGSWITEGSPKAVYALSITSADLTPKKLAAMTVWSEEISELSVPAIESIVRDSLAHDLASVLDASLLDAVAVSTARPAGLWNGATSITASAATSANDAMFVDMQALLASISTNAADCRPLFIMHSKQALRVMGLTLPADRGFEILVSNFMTAGSVGAVDAGAIAMMVGDLTFTASTEATLHLDTVPSPISAVGSPNTISAPVRSMFQEGLIALRSVLVANWVKRRAGCTALCSSVLW